jgi:hypothetical protein
MVELKQVELIQAGAVIYGNQAILDGQFLERLHLADLKKAYRRKSLETHPDLFVHLGRAQQRTYTELFQEVREAYEKLSGYLKLRAQMTPSLYSSFANVPNNNIRTNQGAPFSPEAANSNLNPSGSDTQSPFSTSAPLPPWRLRTGEFLFYCGLIPWNALIQAILWQSRRRERIGEIACRWGWLTDGLVWDLLRDKQMGERLGGVLLRHTLISPFQLKMLLIHQQRQQPPIGEFFLENGLLSERQLLFLLERLNERNRRFERKTGA